MTTDLVSLPTRVSGLLAVTLELKWGQWKNAVATYWAMGHTVSGRNIDWKMIFYV